MQLGIAGVVIDGAVRDSVEIGEMGFPVYSVGTNPNGPTKFVAGRINHPICSAASPSIPATCRRRCATASPSSSARRRAHAAAGRKKVADETERIAADQAGQGPAPAWLDGALRAAGVLKEGETL